MSTEGLWQFASFILINSVPLPSLIPSLLNIHLILPTSHVCSSISGIGTLVYFPSGLWPTV